LTYRDAGGECGRSRRNNLSFSSKPISHPQYKFAEVYSPLEDQPFFLELQIKVVDFHFPYLDEVALVQLSPNMDPFEEFVTSTQL
jgi:hypothetical protein